MEKITLNNRQLDFLASHHPVLEPFFFGTVPCDKLPRHPDKSNPTGYIVNTDPHYLPGKHWIALWTDGKTCEVMDSYALPLSTYGTTDPLVDWLNFLCSIQYANQKPIRTCCTCSTDTFLCYGLNVNFSIPVPYSLDKWPVTVLILNNSFHFPLGGYSITILEQNYYCIGIEPLSLLQFIDTAVDQTAVTHQHTETLQRQILLLAQVEGRSYEYT